MNPKTFISYAWESDELKKWVKDFAIRLRADGVDLTLDQWELVPGDQTPHFMERSVRENDYILILCTPKYKEKSDNRIGGVGYEGDIMTSEVLKNSNHRKFIPILKSGNDKVSIPAWLDGKYYIDLSNDLHYQNNYEDVITTLYNAREKAPALGNRPSSIPKSQTNTNTIVENDEIKIKGILVDEITTPSMDGSRGSALYSIPFELTRTPPYEWREFFVQSWNSPPSFSLMHRPGIASVYGNKIVLNGTTIQEVEKTHKETLKLCINETNKSYKEYITAKRQRELAEQKRLEEHRKTIDDITKRIDFD